MNSRKWRIAVLCGGDSPERDVSLETGEAVAAALDERGHAVRLIDVRGRTLGSLGPADCDVAFIALHGEFGEDGGVQALLEARGIPYTGSGVEASRRAMDKVAAKAAFATEGVPAPAGAVLADDAPAERRRAAVVAIGFPQIIKPAVGGSSIGVSAARSVPEAMAGLDACFALDRRAVIERMIRGRELTVGILGRRTLPVIEIKYPGAIFDYDAKYTPNGAEHIIAPELPAGAEAAVRAAALAAHHALGCRELSRVDLILGDDGRPYAIEVNTIPGMTRTSLVPDAARAAGIDFGGLCETIVRIALRRAAREGLIEKGAPKWAADDKR